MLSGKANSAGDVRPGDIVRVKSRFGERFGEHPTQLWVVLEGESREVGQLVELWRELTAEHVVAEVEFPEVGEVADFRRDFAGEVVACLLYTSPSPRDRG